MGAETRALSEMGTGTGTRTGSGRAEERQRSARNRTRSVRRDVGNGGDLVGKRKRRRQERVMSVAANPDNLENSQGLSKNYYCKSRERVSPLSRLIRGFRNKYH